MIMGDVWGRSTMHVVYVSHIKLTLKKTPIAAKALLEMSVSHICRGTAAPTSSLILALFFNLK